MKRLEQQVENAPTEPGIYFMWGENFECLYIGKSTNIRKRLKDHLEKFRHCEEIRASLDYDDSEMEQYAMTQYATHEVYANKNEVVEITTKTYRKTGILEEIEKTFIQSMLPKYNDIHNHTPINSELVLDCSECGNRLYYKKTAGTCGGYVCKNDACRHYWKLGKGDVVEVVEE